MIGEYPGPAGEREAARQKKMKSSLLSGMASIKRCSECPPIHPASMITTVTHMRASMDRGRIQRAAVAFVGKTEANASDNSVLPKRRSLSA